MKEKKIIFVYPMLLVGVFLAMLIPTAFTLAATTVGNNVSVGGTLGVTGALTTNGNVTIGNAASDTVTVTADVASNLLPNNNNGRDIGAYGSAWNDVFASGSVYMGIGYVTAGMLPTQNNNTQLGLWGGAWSTVYVSSTSYLAASQSVLGAAETMLVDASTTAHTSTNGALELNFDSGTANATGLFVNTNLSGNVNGVAGVKSVLTSSVAGTSETSAFEALAIGSATDSDAAYYGFYASSLAKNGGTSTNAAFITGTGWDYGLYVTSGSEAAIYVEAGIAQFDGNIATNTSTSAVEISAYNDTATSTIQINSGGAGLGGRLILEDIDGAGCSEGTTLNGAITWKTVVCP